MSDSDAYNDILKKILDEDPDFILKFGDEAHESHVRENKYIPPNLLSKEQTNDAISDICVSFGNIKNTLSRGDRVYYDVNAIIDEAIKKMERLYID